MRRTIQRRSVWSMDLSSYSRSSNQIDRRNQTDQTNQLPAMDQEMVLVSVEWYGCDRGVQKPERITGRRTRPSELT